MDEVEKARRQIRLVPLQVTDEVPTRSTPDRGDLVSCLLNSVLADIGQSGCDRLSNPLDRHRLAHPDQRYLFWRAACTLRRRGDPALHRFEVRSDTAPHGR